MNRSVVTVLVIAAALSAAQGTDQNASDRRETVEQQAQLAPPEAACENLDRAEKEMQEVFAQLEEAYRPDNSVWARLQLSQDTWERFRTAHLDFLYGDPGSSVGFGSTLPICVCKAAHRMTVNRIQQLKGLIDEDTADRCIVGRQ